MAAGTGLPPHLVRYWTVGEGGTRIRWGQSGDFSRCRIAINEKITEGGDAPLPDRIISGLCATLHKIAIGHTPGNAPGERNHKG